MKFVYVVNAENVVEQRRISTGELQSDGLRVVTQGLKPNEWIVIGGLQQVRQHAKIKPDRMPMQLDAGEKPAEKSPEALPSTNQIEAQPATGSQPKK